ncbi:MAG: PepSY domain-containing protein [Spirochaetia bacterium]|nr:PepSY domain-containing protein [Spirochaetia bacterium]
MKSKKKTSKTPSDKPGTHHLRFWRWHFFAGLIVAPILIVSAFTGGLYVLKPYIDEWTYGDLLRVPSATPGSSGKHVSEKTLSLQTQFDLVKAHSPESKITSVLPAAKTGATSEFLVQKGGETRRIFIDPLSGRIIGERTQADLMDLMIRIHKNLLLGGAGRTLVELAVSWGVVLILTGLYLWWPRGRKKGILWPRLSLKGRNFWRDLHAVTGALTGLIILILFITGISWTRFAGGNIDKLSEKIGRNTPGAYWFNIPVRKNPGAAALDLDALFRKLEGKALPLPYEIILPKNENQALLIRGNHREDRSKMFALQIDPYTGKVIFENRWGDNNAVIAKPHLIGVSLHMGEFFGLPNRLLMFTGCLGVFFLPVSGIILWWKRRPKGELAAPKKERKPIPIWLWIALGLFGVALPAFGMTLAGGFLLDWIWGRIRT